MEWLKKQVEPSHQPSHPRTLAPPHPRTPAPLHPCTLAPLLAQLERARLEEDLARTFQYSAQAQAAE
eukprot:6259803-Prymnesium_polylepis.1